MQQLTRWMLCALLCIPIPGWEGRDPLVFKSKPWKQVEQQRDSIEKNVLSGNVGRGFVLSALNLYEWKNTPAFNQIATSVYRALIGCLDRQGTPDICFTQGGFSNNPQGRS
jgi:hypothetical protein